MKTLTSLLVAALALTALHCSTEPLPEGSDDTTMTAEEELKLQDCLSQLGFFDGGVTDPTKIVAAVKACLADAGFPFNGNPPFPPFPKLDAGSFPKFDAGLPPFPSFDAGSLPKFDAGLPPFPSFDAGSLPKPDAGLPPFPNFDAGSPPPTPSFDAGSSLFQPCAAACTCPTGKTCLNPAQATCPAKFAVCL